MKLKKENLKIISLFIFSFSVLSFNFLPYAHAVSPTEKPTPTTSKNAIPTDSVELEKIQKIKDIVASKVAELDLVEKRGIIGKVKEKKNMRLIVEDIKGNIRNIDVDELTNFSIGESSKKNTLGISDLDLETIYSFVGIYNKDTQRLLARTITKSENIPVFFEGIISSTDSKEYQIVVADAKGEKKTVDIQGSTKTSVSNSSGDIMKSGFSKLTEGQRVLVVGFNDLKDKNLISATRVLHFEKLPPSKEMQQYFDVTSVSPSPTPKS